MDERQDELIRLALVFMNANLDAVCETFDSEEQPDKLDFNGEVIDIPTEDEIEELLKEFQ